MADNDDQGLLSAAERAAMKEHVAELKAAKKAPKGAAKLQADLQACLDKIEALPGVEHELAAMLHQVVTEVAPDLAPRTWYGFPAYADGKGVVVFFQYASKFGTRYSTIGFNASAHLDRGQMWPVAYAVTGVTDQVRDEVRELVRRAVS